MAWTLQPIIIEQSHNYLRWRLHCISDGNALTATDIFSESYTPRDLKSRLQGHTYMRMDYVPDGTLTPTDEITITLSNTVGTTMWSGDTTAAATAETFDLSTDIAMYPTFYAKMFIAFDDPGAAGEVFDLYFECWKESGCP